MRSRQGGDAGDWLAAAALFALAWALWVLLP